MLNIRLEIDGMKQAVVATLTQRVGQMDDDIREAVERACSEDNIRHVIDDAADRAVRDLLSAAVQDAVRSVRYEPSFKAMVQRMVKDSFPARRDDGNG